MTAAARVPGPAWPVASLLPMTSWTRVAQSDEITRDPRRVDGPDGPLVLVRRVDGSVAAADDHCPHLGTSLAGGGVDGDELTCSGHFYSYDLGSGAHTTPGSPIAGRLSLCAVREVDGHVEVRPEPA